MTKKLYIVKKYIYAPSLKEALKAEQTTPVDDIWIDDTWRNNNMANNEDRKIDFNK